MKIYIDSNPHQHLDIAYLSECITEIKTSMDNNNILCLNGDPIEVRLIGSRHQISNAGHLYLTLDGLVVEVQSRVRNLQVIFEANLSFDSLSRALLKPLFSSSEILQDCALC